MYTLAALMGPFLEGITHIGNILSFNSIEANKNLLFPSEVPFIPLSMSYRDPPLMKYLFI